MRKFCIGLGKQRRMRRGMRNYLLQLLQRSLFLPLLLQKQGPLQAGPWRIRRQGNRLLQQLLHRFDLLFFLRLLRQFTQIVRAPPAEILPIAFCLQRLRRRISLPPISRTLVNMQQRQLSAMRKCRALQLAQ